MNTALLIGIIAFTLRASSPLIYAAMAGILCERSGVVNIALEGMMLIGAFTGLAVGATHGAPAGVMAALVSGALLGLLHATTTQKMRVGDIVSGVAINILALGLTSYFSRIPALSGAAGAVIGVPEWSVTLPLWIPSFGGLKVSQSPFTIGAWLCVLSVAYFLWRTPWGLRVTAAGENPAALKAAGVNVVRVRFGAVIVGGALAALGGAQLSLGLVHNFTENMTAGRGYIALAAVVFGRWRPGGAFAACLFLAFADALQSGLQVIPSIGERIPTEFMAMLPYAATLIALVFFSKQVRGPGALNQSGD